MIADTGCPNTMNDKDSIAQYIFKNNLDVQRLTTRDVQMVFKFGESNFISRKVIDLPIKLKILDANNEPDIFLTMVPT